MIGFLERSLDFKGEIRDARPDEGLGKRFDPNQPRDDHGRWTDVPGVSAIFQAHGVKVYGPGRRSKLKGEDREVVTGVLADAMERYPALAPKKIDLNHPERRPLRRVFSATSDLPIAQNIAPELVKRHSIVATASTGKWNEAVFVINDQFDPFRDPRVKRHIDVQVTPASASGYEGSTWHEVGHLLAYASGAVTPENFLWQDAADKMAEYGIERKDWAGLSQYAATNPMEGLGELSAMYHTPGFADKLSPELRAKAKRLFDHLGGVT